MTTTTCTSLAKRISLAALMVVSLLFSAMLGGAPSAVAQSNSCVRHSYGNDFDGYQTYASNNYAGSYGYLTTQQALLCTNDTNLTNFSTAWVMLAASSGQNFGQIGYFETYNRGTHWFTAYQEDARGVAYYEYDDFATTIGSGSTYQYAATKAENDPHACPSTANHSCITFLLDGSLFGVPTQFPWSGSGGFPQPDEGQFFGEVHYYTSDVPGTYVHAQFANLAWLSGGYVRSSNFGPNQLYSYDSDTYYFRQSGLGTGPTFSIWDGFA